MCVKDLFTCNFIHTGKIQVWSRRENKQSGVGKENGQHSEEVSRGFFSWREIDVQHKKILVRIVSLFHSSIHSFLSHFSAVLSRGWMENPRTFPRLQLISLRMCLCGKAWRERKSSSTSGDSIRLTSVPAATGRSWCNNSRMTGGHRDLSLTRAYAILEESTIIIKLLL